MTDEARKVWRECLASAMSYAQLKWLRDGLAANDGRLCCGDTVLSSADGKVKRVCPVLFGLCEPGWPESSDEAEEIFTVVVNSIVKLTGRRLDAFFTWVDGNEWEQVRADLLTEVELSLNS